MKLLKTLRMIICLKKLILFMLPTLVNQLKTKYNTKIKKNEEKIHDHDKYITTSDFNK